MRIPSLTFFSVALTLIILFSNLRCGQIGNSNLTPSETAIAVIAGPLSIASGLTVGEATPARNFWFETMTIPQALAATSCPTYANPGSATCNSSAITFTYDSCNFDSSTAIWKGSQTLTFGGGFTCGTSSLPMTLSGNTLSRTFGTSTSRTSTATFALDSANSAGWSVPVSGGSLTTVTASGGHTIRINGIRITAPSVDYSVSSTADILVANPGNSRKVTSGTLLVQDNYNRTTATTVVTTTLEFTAGCCLPTAGVITTDYKLGKTGKETLTFNSTCGSAEFTDTNSTTTTVNLVNCF